MRPSSGTISPLRAVILWWCLLGGGIVSFFLHTWGLWFDGFDFLNIIILPGILIVVSVRSLVARVFMKPCLEDVLAWMMWAAIGFAIWFRLDVLVASMEPSLLRGVLAEPCKMLLGYVVGLLIGYRTEFVASLFGSRANMLIVCAVFGGLVLTPLGHSDLVRVGGGHVFAFGDALTYVAIGVLAPLLLARKGFYVLTGIVSTGMLFFLVGIRGHIVAFAASMLGVLLLMRIQQRMSSDPGARVALQTVHRFARFVSGLLFVEVAGISFLTTTYNLSGWLGRMSERTRVVFSGGIWEDASVVERSQMMQFGLGLLTSGLGSLLFGSFAYEYLSIGRGAYIHNASSMLAEFGLLTLVPFIALWGKALLTAARLRLSTLENMELVWLFLHWSIAFLLFRTYHTLHFWVALGAVLGRRRRLMQGTACL